MSSETRTYRSQTGRRSRRDFPRSNPAVAFDRKSEIVDRVIRVLQVIANELWPRSDEKLRRIAGLLWRSKLPRFDALVHLEKNRSEYDIEPISSAAGSHYSPS